MGNVKIVQGLSKEIPAAISMQGWKDVKIDESDEPMVCLNPLAEKYRLMIQPQYFLQGINGASDQVFMREGAVEKIIRASEVLPSSYKLIIFDAFRPLTVQNSLFDDFKRKLREVNPTKREEDLTALTEVYVSLPSYDSLKPSPHSTGGAVDLSIVKDGELVDMGTSFDSFDVSSRTDFFATINPSIHTNRNMLYCVMSEAGFANYPEEWWHYDYGNQFWGFLKDTSAIYGRVKYD